MPYHMGLIRRTSALLFLALAFGFSTGACDADAQTPSVAMDSAGAKDARGKPQAQSPKPRVQAHSKEHSTSSSSSETTVRDVVMVAGEPWTILHKVNPKGSFSLVRNASVSTSPAEPLHVLLGTRQAHVLGPRETVAWDCDVIAGDTALTVKTRVGTVVYRARVQCGDAVYINAGHRAKVHPAHLRGGLPEMAE